jgi:bacteriocin biosynthesis cyclodehydratase domain-containing protein
MQRNSASQLMAAPRLRADVRASVVAPATVILRDGDDLNLVIESRALAAMLPLLDGETAFERIAVAIADRATLTDIAVAIRWLADLGLIVDGPVEGDAAAAAYWEAAGVDGAEAARRLRGASITTLALGDVALDPLNHALAELGIGVAEQAPLTCVLVDDYLRPELEELNSRLAQARSPWLLARPVGRDVWLGPLFRIPETGCWACLAQRLARHPAGEPHPEAPPPPAGGWLPSTARTAATLVATQAALTFASGGSATLEGKLITINTCTLESRTHVLIRDRGCSVCGTPAPRADQGRVVLHATPKVETRGGGHRTQTSKETLERLLPEVSPLIGTVGALRRLPSRIDELVHVWISESEIGRYVRGGPPLIAGFRWPTAGKGTSEVEAKAGAVCEAIERYCGRFRQDVPRLTGTLADRGDAAVAPHELLLFSERQYAQRQMPGTPNGLRNDVPLRFDGNRAIDWTRVWSLTGDRPRELPSAFCWYGYPDGNFCHADSNGCAAGITMEEATLHGVLELVERDSVALWWYTRGRVPGVDLDSFSDRYVDELRERLDRVGRELWALDLTSDLGIPALVALSRRSRERPEQILLGFGAHLDPRVALTRAVTEHNQLFAVLESFPRAAGPEFREWLDGAAVGAEPWLRPREGARARRLADFPALASADDIAVDVRTCVDRLAAAGLETLVLDQSRSDIDVRVVRVTVPGLRHFWRRLAPGRLYDVPPALGWVETTPRETDLNPRSVFL